MTQPATDTTQLTDEPAADVKDLFKGDEEPTEGDTKDDDSTDGGRSGKDAPASDSKTEGEPGDKKDGEGEPVKEPPKEEEPTFRPESGYEKFAYGEEVPIDEPLEKSFVDFATTLNAGKGLSQKDAQAVIDFYQKEVFGALDRAGQAARPAWKEESHADPTYGGAKYAQSTEDIEAFLTLCDNQAIADNYKPRQGLRDWLETTGWIDYAPLRAALALAGENLTREPSGPQGQRRQGRRVEHDVGTSRGLGQVLFGESEEDEE